MSSSDLVRTTVTTYAITLDCVRTTVTTYAITLDLVRVPRVSPSASECVTTAVISLPNGRHKSRECAQEGAEGGGGPHLRDKTPG